MKYLKRLRGRVGELVVVMVVGGRAGAADDWGWRWGRGWVEENSDAAWKRKMRSNCVDAAWKRKYREGKQFQFWTIATTIFSNKWQRKNEDRLNNIAKIQSSTPLNQHLISNEIPTNEKIFQNPTKKNHLTTIISNLLPPKNPPQSETEKK